MKEEGWSELPAVTLTYNTSENHKKIAEAVQSMYKKNLGVDIKLSNQEWKTYLDTTQQKNFQMARMGGSGSWWIRSSSLTTTSGQPEQPYQLGQ